MDRLTVVRCRRPHPVRGRRRLQRHTRRVRAAYVACRGLTPPNSLGCLPEGMSLTQVVKTFNAVEWIKDRLNDIQQVLGSGPKDQLRCSRPP